MESAKTRLLKNVQNQFSRCFGSREMSKTEAGTLQRNFLAQSALKVQTAHKTTWVRMHVHTDERIGGLLEMLSQL